MGNKIVHRKLHSIYPLILVTKSSDHSHTHKAQCTLVHSVNLGYEIRWCKNRPKHKRMWEQRYASKSEREEWSCSNPRLQCWGKHIKNETRWKWQPSATIPHPFGTLSPSHMLSRSPVLCLTLRVDSAQTPSKWPLSNSTTPPTPHTPRSNPSLPHTGRLTAGSAHSKSKQQHQRELTSLRSPPPPYHLTAHLCISALQQ